MKIMNLVKSEFIKHYSIKRFVIIFLVLLTSSLFLIHFTDDLLGKRYGDNKDLQGSIDSITNSIKIIEEKETKTFDDEYSLFFEKNYIEYMTLVKEKQIEARYDWKITVVEEELLPAVMQNYLIEKLKENPNNEDIVKLCNSVDEYSFHKNSKVLHDVCGNYDVDELDKLYNKNLLIIEDYKKLLEENKYYLYLQYQIDHNLIPEDEFTKLLLAKKVESNTGFLGLNYIQYQRLEKNSKIEIMSKEEYDQAPNDNYTSYQEYVTYNSKLKNNAIKNRNILLYSTEHEIKNDIAYHGLDGVTDDIRYMNTKIKVNQVFHLSIIVMLIVSITSGGIISTEHSRGTIKNIITAPVRRWKILLSKFIYLVLDTYVIWLLGLLIISICAGIQYGFHDLLEPELIYAGNQVVEVNYYLYTIKNIFMASIPVICFLSILFFLSTVTLNTSLTVGITSALPVVSFFLWITSIIDNFKYIVYTPFWYFDCGYIFNNAELYVSSLRKMSYSLSTGIIISLVVALVLYVISNIVYIKRDIKN